MKTVIVGDVHAEFGRFNKFLSKRKSDVVIACGDFGYWPRHIDMDCIKAHNTKVYFCDGNHEDHRKLKSLTHKQEPAEITDNVFYMPRGTTLQHEGLTWLFVGGALSIDKHFRVRDQDWFEEELITEEDFNRLPDINVDVVISHTAPNFLLRNYNLCTLGTEEKFFDPSTHFLNGVFKKYLPKYWYFGHFHKKFSIEHNYCLFFGLNMIPDDGWWRYLYTKDLGDYEDRY